MPVQLRQLVGMGAKRQGGELAVGHHRKGIDLAHRLADPLVLVERGDAAGVVADHHVRFRLIHRDLDLAIDGEGPGEFALADDVAEAEAAAIVPGGIVDHLGAERLQQAGGHRDAVAVQHIVVIDHVLGHHLVDMARRVHGRADVRDVDFLVVLQPVAHDVQPFGVVHQFFRDQELAIDQTAQLAQDLGDFLAQFGGMDQEMTHFLVVAERGAAMDQRIIGALGQPLRLPEPW
jgi:hypothetical protein